MLPGAKPSPPLFNAQAGYGLLLAPNIVAFPGSAPDPVHPRHAGQPPRAGLVTPARFELAASAFGGQRSIR